MRQPKHRFKHKCIFNRNLVVLDAHRSEGYLMLRRAVLTEDCEECGRHEVSFVLGGLVFDGSGFLE